VGRSPAYARLLMADDGLGPWKPLELGDVVQLFERWPARWWISGGVALELHVGRSWRTHHDSDVSILRDDAPALPVVLAGWDIQVAAAGTLTPWDGSVPEAAASQNNVWCRKARDQPWCLDVTISEGDQQCWIYRRDPTLRVPWEEAVLRDQRGIAYLAPELQLLFKSKNNRPKDDRDAAQAIPALAAGRQLRLRGLLPEDHPWQVLLAP
jgi:Aminoglycoside-2''-adenylyltransferase